VVNAIPRHAIELKISAARAVSETQKWPGDTLGIEAFIAGVAPPWAETCCSGEKIGRAAASRPEAIRATALWADHL
jgi:hypothetical protein